MACALLAGLYAALVLLISYYLLVLAFVSCSTASKATMNAAAKLTKKISGLSVNVQLRSTSLHSFKMMKAACRSASKTASDTSACGTAALSSCLLLFFSKSSVILILKLSSAHASQLSTCLGCLSL